MFSIVFAKLEEPMGKTAKELYCKHIFGFGGVTLL